VRQYVHASIVNVRKLSTSVMPTNTGQHAITIKYSTMNTDCADSYAVAQNIVLAVKERFKHTHPAVSFRNEPSISLAVSAFRGLSCSQSTRCVLSLKSIVMVQYCVKYESVKR
jgi:hypothetical protein